MYTYIFVFEKKKEVIPPLKNLADNAVVQKIVFHDKIKNLTKANFIDHSH